MRLLPVALALLVGLAEAQTVFERAAKAIHAGSYEEALSILKALSCTGPEAAACAARQQFMSGTALLFSGRYEEADRSFQQSLEAYRRLNDRRQIVDLLNNLGTVAYYRGDYGGAFEWYQAAEQEVMQAAGEPWYASALDLTRVNQATLLQRLGRYRAALDLYHKVGSRPEALPPTEKIQLLSNLAVLNRRLGDPYKAREYLEESLRLSRQGMHRDAWLGAVKNLGILQALDFGDWPGAAARFEEVLRQAEKDGAAREALQARLYLAQACFAQGQVGRAEALWRRTLTDSRVLKTPEEEWRSQFGLARAFRSQARITEAKDALRQSIAGIERLRSGIGAASLKSEFLSDKTSVYDELLEIHVEENDLAGAWGTLQSGRALLLKDELGLLPAVGLAEFQRRLRPGEMAIALRLSRRQTFTFWITPQSAGVKKHETGEERVIELAGRVEGDVDGAAEAKQELARLLLPQSAVAANVNRVWILPDGVLSTLPFDLLPAGNGPLLRRWEIVYLPAASMLRKAVPQDGRIWPWRTSAVIYSDPQPEQARLLPGDERWGPLPGSRREAGEVATQIPGRVELVSGGGITSAGLIQKAAGVPILHLSTHGAGDMEDGERSRLLIGDGYLFAGQLKPGQLGGVRLAVLSACETERGQYSRGEGVQSLANAFLGSGAGATVASLWKVDDAATTLFMTEFYRNLREGKAVAEALRSTKLRFLDSGGSLAHPRYWAAFIVQGAGDLKTPPPWPWGWMFAGGALFLLGVVFSRRRGPRSAPAPR